MLITTVPGEDLRVRPEHGKEPNAEERYA